MAALKNIQFGSSSSDVHVSLLDAARNNNLDKVDEAVRESIARGIKIDLKDRVIIVALLNSFLFFFV